MPQHVLLFRQIQHSKSFGPYASKELAGECLEMLTCVPTVNPKSMNNYFRSIESKLSFYESLNDSPALLELAIWR